ncbi:MAG TPA: carboxypeptidase-like regulatory domain-containing protein, partial [Blastocatellia bacterium]|nr:carboxypeptidase-like regulatory domain-containing protein [Blastocatellia bacterium]
MSGTGRRKSAKLRLAGCSGLALIAVIAGLGQTPTPLFEVSGVVLDPNGAAIPEAKVILRREGVRSEQAKTANQRGLFRFTRLAPGNYEIEARKEGFKPDITRITLGPNPKAPLEIVLQIAEVRAEVAVDERLNQVNTNPNDNLNVIKLDREDLKKLPVLG